MKFRTDFVTNSSSSCYLTFNIQNKKMYEFLESLGIKIEDTPRGEFSDGMTVVLPSGKRAKVWGDYVDSPTANDISTISQWLMTLILEENEYKNHPNGFSEELLNILDSADVSKLSKFNKYDAEIENGEIEYGRINEERRVEDSGKFTITEGKKKIIDVNGTFINDESEDIFEMAEKTGKASTNIEIWNVDHWEREGLAKEKEELAKEKEELRNIIKNVIDENELLRKLIIVNCKEKNANEEYSKQVELANKISFEELVEKGYILFNDENVIQKDEDIISKIESLKCLISIERENFSNKGRDIIKFIKFIVYCSKDNWRMDEYTQRPIEIVNSIVNAIEGTEYGSHNGRLKFVGINNENIYGTTIKYVEASMNVSKAKTYKKDNECLNNVKEYKQIYKIIVDKIFEDVEYRKLLFVDSKNVNANINDLIENGLIILNSGMNNMDDNNIACKVEVSVNFESDLIAQIHCNIFAKKKDRNLSDGSDCLEKISDYINKQLNSLNRRRRSYEDKYFYDEQNGEFIIRHIDKKIPVWRLL